MEVDHREEEDSDSSCSSSSSIGANSDVSSQLSSDGEDPGETEVQSSLKGGGPLDTMDVLKDVLPIRRGISKHYSGKSKSYTSLADAMSTPSIKHIAKPEDLYNKKRKNELAHGKNFNKSYNNLPKSSSGTSLRRMGTTNPNRSTLSNNENCKSISVSPPSFLPPLHPPIKRFPADGSSSSSTRHNNNIPCRSFSLVDLQCFAPVNANTSLVINNTIVDNKLH